MATRTLHFFLFVLLVPAFATAQIYPRQDTLFIPETGVLPLIDGTIDEVWDKVNWSNIDQIWMPWNNDPANLNQGGGVKLWEGADDFTGKFKIMWSSQTNLLYFLVEVVDDVFVDGYVFPNSAYPDFDIVEIFIDEDRSGGPHVFNGVLWPGMSNCPTCNAENAFAYHIATNAPAEGEVQNEFYAVDMTGSNWGNLRNYAEHFPEFSMRKNGNTYTYEFSLIVHNDTYDHSNQPASVVTLEEGKIMGLTVAYCDNDTPGTKRDHFFGSVDVPLHAHNDHWIDANWFGAAKLVGEGSTSLPFEKISERTQISVFFAHQKIQAEISSTTTGPVQVRIINILGSEIFREYHLKDQGTHSVSIPMGDLQKGIYLVEVIHGNSRKVEKISIR